MGKSNKKPKQTDQIWKGLFTKAIHTPYLVLPGLFALLNGYLHKLFFKVTTKNITIGRAFRVYGRFIVMGCGHVHIGDNCFVQSKLFGYTSFLTARPDATIEVGNNVGFSGTTIQSYEKVSIGDWSNIANAYIVDTPAHFLSADRRFVPVEELPTSPVIIEKNVWVSAGVVICHGVCIGENSVIGACSLIRKNIPINSFWAGNPAHFIKKIPMYYKDTIHYEEV